MNDMKVHKKTMLTKITAPLTLEQEFCILIQKQPFVKIHISTAFSFLLSTENLPSLSFRFSEHVAKFNTRLRRTNNLIVVFQSSSDGAL